MVKRRLAEAGQLQQPPLTLLTDGRRAHSEPNGAHTVKVFGQGANSLSQGPLDLFICHRVMIYSRVWDKHTPTFINFGIFSIGSTHFVDGRTMRAQ